MLNTLIMPNSASFANFLNPDECPDCGMATGHMTYLQCLNHIFNCEGEGLPLTEMTVEIADKKSLTPFSGDKSSRR